MSNNGVVLCQFGKCCEKNSYNFSDVFIVRAVLKYSMQTTSRRQLLHLKNMAIKY